MGTWLRTWMLQDWRIQLIFDSRLLHFNPNTAGFDPVGMLLKVILSLQL